MKTYHTQQKYRLAWIIYLVFAIALGCLATSCSTQKGYNYKKHYKTQRAKKKIVRFFRFRPLQKKQSYIQNNQIKVINIRLFISIEIKVL